MKLGAIICSAIFVIAVALGVIQLWTGFLDTELFIKLSITLAALFIVALGVALVIREYVSDKKMKQGGFIDE